LFYCLDAIDSDELPENYDCGIRLRQVCSIRMGVGVSDMGEHAIRN
jgi:hypothetical protein